PGSTTDSPPSARHPPLDHPGRRGLQWNRDKPQLGEQTTRESMVQELALKLDDPLLLRNQCFINGQWINADSRESIDVSDPASGALVGRVPRMGEAETERAIQAAERALPAWRARTAADRAAILHRWYELLMQNQEDLARLMTLEQGKPISESRGE